MSRRGHRESLVPMDFEYDNKSGPIDATSPFFTATTTPARSRELNPTAPSPFLGQGTPQLNRRPFAGTQSHLDSPTKNAFATPSRLRDTAANFPQSGSRPLPSIPQHVSPWLPRTPAADYDFSSGGETPNTPAHDSEQATPDTHMASRMQLLMDSPSPKKPGRRHSFFRAIRNFGSPSPTKEKEDIKEIKTEVSRKHYAEKMENRVAKRRSTRSDRASKKKRIALSNGGGGDDDDDDDEPAPPQPAALSPPSTAQHTYSASIAGFFHWLEAHPGLPAVLSYYLQFTLNAILALSFVYILYLIWDSVTADIGIEASKHQSELMVEIAACVKNYRENRCEPDTRVPAMEMACGNWETCMGRDPRKLARASVTVKAFAHIINGFFEEFSYKSMVRQSIHPSPNSPTPTNPHPRSSSPSSSSAASTSQTGPSVYSANNTNTPLSPRLHNTNNINTLTTSPRHPTASPRQPF